MTRAASVTGSGQADELRLKMTDVLVEKGWVASPEVEAAFRSVPRHLFTPDGTPLDQAYDADQSVITKSDADGVHLSSVSAPFVQAAMIGQAGVRPGMRVLEVGSGGYQAALLAEVTGPGGHVVTMDIDPEVTSRTRELLEQAGHASRVTVVTGDAAGGAPGHGEFDAIIVTCGAWDIPPAWTGQLTPGTGTLVVPLRMNGSTRSVAFRQRGAHWSSLSHVYCGFVPIRGEDAFAVQAFRLPRPDGGEVTLRFETGAPEDPALLDGILATPQVTRWSGVLFPSGVPYAGLELWLGGFQPGFCRASAGGKGGKSWVPYGAAVRDSLGVLAQRWRDDAGMFEFGATAWGPDASGMADMLNAQVAAWDAAGRDIEPDGFTFWPADTAVPPAGPLTAVFPKVHGTVTVTFPGRPAPAAS